jgi:hypothetical protein
MKRALGGLLLVVMLMGAAFAQDASAAGTAASREDVLRLLDLLQIKARMVQMLGGMKDGMRTGALTAFKQKVPNPTPDQISALNTMIDPIFQDFPINEMVDAMVPIYQKHLTKEDLDAAIAFYASPSGQKILREQPAMMSEAMKAGQDVMVARIPDISKRMQAAVDKLAAEQGTAGSSTDSQPNKN